MSRDKAPDLAVSATTTSRAVVLDLDGSITRQTAFLDHARPQVISMRHLSGDPMRYWASPTAHEQLALTVRAALGSSLGHAIFYGSSDYHNVTYGLLWLLEEVGEPVTVVHFDNHTDWLRQTGPRNTIAAGDWANHSLRLPWISKIIQFGVDGDLSFVEAVKFPVGTWSHPLHLMTMGRVEVYPTTMAESRLLGRVHSSGDWARVEPGRLRTRVHWQTVREHGAAALAAKVFDRIPTAKVYLTIDKDALTESEAFTNYGDKHQGNMHLAEMVDIVRVLGQQRELIGMDVTGDGSLASYPRWSLKGAFTRWKDDQIPVEHFDDPKHTAINEQANIALIDVFDAVAAR